ncbi:hypothetical protein RLO149_p630490 (plasmid) [Roseobacter litoralis Och 149]|uniref:Uncharacterized protein n=1 Tax=Roseobacter litoralis (strain ATCC 49566 / DSM 6996 / JCM 21268 / NBRC 15278 / OCh 149) TaxID=391595 RepID=F7ZMM0_ROSLO|nr:hypothetical protein RLO149_p630490 [Roseobacter litoralis Och 149]
MDTFASHSQSLNAPIRSGIPVSPDNNTDLPGLPRALYVGNGGDITARLVDEGTITLTVVPQARCCLCTPCVCTKQARPPPTSWLCGDYICMMGASATLC